MGGHAVGGVWEDPSRRTGPKLYLLAAANVYFQYYRSDGTAVAEPHERLGVAWVHGIHWCGARHEGSIGCTAGGVLCRSWDLEPRKWFHPIDPRARVGLELQRYATRLHIPQCAYRSRRVLMWHVEPEIKKKRRMCAQKLIHCRLGALMTDVSCESTGRFKNLQTCCLMELDGVPHGVGVGACVQRGMKRPSS